MLLTKRNFTIRLLLHGSVVFAHVFAAKAHVPPSDTILDGIKKEDNTRAKTTLTGLSVKPKATVTTIVATTVTAIVYTDPPEAVPAAARTTYAPVPGTIPPKDHGDPVKDTPAIVKTSAPSTHMSGPAVVPSKGDGKCGREYVVRIADSCEKIAWHFGISLDELLRLNEDVFAGRNKKKKKEKKCPILIGETICVGAVKAIPMPPGLDADAGRTLNSAQSLKSSSSHRGGVKTITRTTKARTNKTRTTNMITTRMTNTTTTTTTTTITTTPSKSKEASTRGTGSAYKLDAKGIVDGVERRHILPPPPSSSPSTSYERVSSIEEVSTAGPLKQRARSGDAADKRANVIVTSITKTRTALLGSTTGTTPESSGSDSLSSSSSSLSSSSSPWRTHSDPIGQTVMLTKQQQSVKVDKTHAKAKIASKTAETNAKTTLESTEMRMATMTSSLDGDYDADVDDRTVPQSSAGHGSSMGDNSGAVAPAAAAGPSSSRLPHVVHAGPQHPAAVDGTGLPVDPMAYLETTDDGQAKATPTADTSLGAKRDEHSYATMGLPTSANPPPRRAVWGDWLPTSLRTLTRRDRERDDDDDDDVDGGGGGGREV